MEITLNGEPIAPVVNMDVSAKIYMQVYKSLYDMISQCSGGTCDLTFDDMTSYGLFIVPLLIDESAGRNDRILLRRNGNIRLNIGFSQPLASNLTAIIFYMTDKLLTIDSNQGVYVT